MTNRVSWQEKKKTTNKNQTPTQGQTNWEQILAAVRSVQGSSPILEGQPGLVYS